MRLGILTIGSLMALALVVGCGSTQQEQKTAETSHSSSTSPTADPPPEVDSCHQLTFQQVSVATSEQEPIPCSQLHTTVTIAVGELDQIQDGHLLSVDSTRIQKQLDQLCPKSLAAFLGGTEEDRELSQFKAAWFTPSLQQADQGANWFRCDAVALKGDSTLMNLPTRAKGILDKPAGAQFATCGTGSPAKEGFAKVACKLPHQWRAAKSIQIPAGSKYLDAGATQVADQSCKDAAASAAGNNLKYTWGFTWSTKEQWDTGFRKGICWLPTQ